MIKIISGKYKGNNLASLSTKVVRPTQARIKKSLLEILGPYDGKSVLDLFSGIGTIGIEMLSRGAKSLTCVEKDRRVFKTLLENLKNICYVDEVEVFCSDYKKYLNKQKMKKFDIIFADPPYESDYFHKLTALIDKPNITTQKALFIYEHFKKNETPEYFGNFKKLRDKTYGDSRISIFKKGEVASND
ncbi:MAG: 16S rRNA (guanine(966)-N(2))-methyltransferase RsmD [Chloroflexota bacterium]|nr:16S rRNA (guanine(966)-N(2))-methyltransferase RsmD [Chloroflexota bacterium]